MSFNFRYLLLFILFLLVWGCSEDPEPALPVENKYLVESSLKSEFQMDLIKGFVTLSGFPEFAAKVENDIEIYKIDYKTIVDNEEIIASGVISIPKGLPGPLPYLSTHRGTIFADNESPTGSNLVYGYEVFAAAGYATVLPDMIGFGSTNDKIQRYYNKETNSQVALDMLKAGEEFLNGKDILLSDQLFLFGYSQGGFITLAVQQAIEDEHDFPWEVTAVAAGAGSYNIEFVMDDVLNRGFFTSPAFLSLIVYSYNNVNSFDKPMSYYFQEPYAGMMPNLLDGSKNQGQVNSELHDSLHLYFQPSFLEGMKNRTETEMINAFRTNSVHDWQPNAPLRLYHSSGDQFIPIADSEITADKMKKGGSDVEFVLIGNGTHGESSITMITQVVPWFESLRTDL